MIDSKDRQSLTAQDAIPKDAIWLTEAYEHLAEFMRINPDLLPDFPGERWSEALTKSRKDDQKANDGAASDEELEEWRQRRRANLLLRLGMDQSQLVACVLHPRSGIVLQLHRKGWIRDDWSEVIPWGIWSDFIFGDYEAPGPSGTLFDGLLRPVFFMRSEYHDWFTCKFGESVHLNDSFASPANPKEGFRRLDAVIEAITKLWGASPPPGLGAQKREDEINGWLKVNGRQPTTSSTIRRALARMRKSAQERK
jgi:hypothetical protein